MTALHISAALGFLAVGVYRYILSPGWNVPKFLKTEPRALLQGAIVTATLAYFAVDLANMLPDTVMGYTLNPSDAVAKAPKLAGFAIGALGSGTDAIAVLRNVVELVPVVGPKIVMVFTRKEVKP